MKNKYIIYCRMSDGKLMAKSIKATTHLNAKEEFIKLYLESKIIHIQYSSPLQSQIRNQYNKLSDPEKEIKEINREIKEIRNKIKKLEKEKRN